MTKNLKILIILFLHFYCITFKHNERFFRKEKKLRGILHTLAK